LWKSSKYLVDYLKTNPVDVIHTHYRRATLVARTVARTTKTPILFTLHLPDISVHGPWKWFTDLGDCVHVPSFEARDWVVKNFHLPLEKIAVIPHGVDPSLFPLATEEDKQTARRKICVDNSRTVAAYVGRFDFPKNEGWMLDLAHQAKTRLPQLFILMQGEGPHMASLQRRIISEELGNHVKLLAPGDPKPCYAACDVLLLPSSREGFSYVSLEAMLTGRPVLRTNTGGTSLQIIENVTGNSVPIDKDLFLNRAIRLLSDKSLLQKMGEAAAQHARQNFTFELQLQKTVALYERLCNR
jgi:glycosyltransferase involved in cell wall biosynthesis